MKNKTIGINKSGVTIPNKSPFVWSIDHFLIFINSSFLILLMPYKMSYQIELERYSQNLCQSNISLYHLFFLDSKNVQLTKSKVFQIDPHAYRNYLPKKLWL